MKHKPIPVYILILLMLFQALSGIAGGLSLVIKPDGSILKMPLSSLAGSSFKNFFIPGLCLFLLLGVLPTITCWGLFLKPKSGWFGSLNIYRNRHWAWAYSLYTGIMLILWIDVEVMVIGYGSILQVIYAILGILILILTLWPGCMKYYKIKKVKK
jgi:hypothetical protein